METIFMNSKNSKTSDSHRLLLHDLIFTSLFNLSEKIN